MREWREKDWRSRAEEEEKILSFPSFLHGCGI
jgi:hypothetical protein